MLEKTAAAAEAVNGGGWGRRHRYVFFAVASLALFMSSASLPMTPGKSLAKKKPA